MKIRGLESAYTHRKHKSHSKKVNESTVPNLLDRQFNGQERLAAVVSDLSYVRVGQKWHYVCILLDLYNREIIEYSYEDRGCDFSIYSFCFGQSQPCPNSNVSYRQGQ